MAGQVSDKMCYFDRLSGQSSMAVFSPFELLKRLEAWALKRGKQRCLKSDDSRVELLISSYIPEYHCCSDNESDVAHRHHVGVLWVQEQGTKFLRIYFDRFDLRHGWLLGERPGRPDRFSLLRNPSPTSSAAASHCSQVLCVLCIPKKCLWYELLWYSADHAEGCKPC